MYFQSTKKKQKNLKQKYRAISLLPIIGKILEKLIFDTLYHQLEVNSLLNPNQSGFRLSDSTFNQLLSIVNSIVQAFDSTPLLMFALFTLTYQRPLTGSGMRVLYINCADAASVVNCF